MKIEVLKVWLENSEELNALLERGGLGVATQQEIRHKGFKNWLNDRILDGANPIDLYIVTEHYIENFIAIRNKDTIREVFWETLTTLTDEHTDYAEKDKEA